MIPNEIPNASFLHFSPASQAKHLFVWLHIAIRGHCKDCSEREARTFKWRLFSPFYYRKSCTKIRETFCQFLIASCTLLQWDEADFSPRWPHWDKLSAHIHGFLLQETWHDTHTHRHRHRQTHTHTHTYIHHISLRDAVLILLVMFFKTVFSSEVVAACCTAESDLSLPELLCVFCHSALSLIFEGFLLGPVN